MVEKGFKKCMIVKSKIKTVKILDLNKRKSSDYFELCFATYTIVSG